MFATVYLECLQFDGSLVVVNWGESFVNGSECLMKAMRPPPFDLVLS